MRNDPASKPKERPYRPSLEYILALEAIENLN